MAGALGVELFDFMQSQGWLYPAATGLGLTDAGRAGLLAWGVDIQPMGTGGTTQGRWAYPCLDWSQRRDHLGGKLAGTILLHFQAQDWLRRVDGERALRLTPKGQMALGAVLPSAAHPAQQAA